MLVARLSLRRWIPVVPVRVLEIALFAFIADVLYGLYSPVFALFARQLGAPIAAVGLLASLIGIFDVAGAIPIGWLADRLPRQRLLTASMATFVVAFSVAAIAPSFLWLALCAALLGIGLVAAFPISMAYLIDVVDEGIRARAIGFYSVAMGCGVVVGPAVGGVLATIFGYRGVFVTGVGVALIGLWVAQTRLRAASVRHHSTMAATWRSRLAAFPRYWRTRPLAVASTASLALNLALSGAILTYFPLHAHQLGITRLNIGIVLAGRAMASVFSRLVVGSLPHVATNLWSLVFALCADGIVLIALPAFSALPWIALALLVDGAAYGIYMVASPLAIAAATTPANRGTYLGINSMVGNLAAFGPGLVGIVVSTSGMAVAFESTAGMLFTAAAAAALLLYLVPGTPAGRAGHRIPVAGEVSVSTCSG